MAGAAANAGQRKAGGPDGGSQTGESSEVPRLPQDRDIHILPQEKASIDAGAWRGLP